MVDAARLNPQRTVQDEQKRLAQVITRIRSLRRGWATMPIVLIPEDGPPGAGEVLFSFVKDMHPIICMAEAGSAAYGQHRYGVSKTQKSTIRMKDKLLLAVLPDARTGVRWLGFSRDLFSVDHIDRGEDVEATLKKLRTQMYNYRVLVQKVYAEKANDDLLIALMMLVSWPDEFIRLRDEGRPAYSQFHRAYMAGRS